MTDRSEMDTQPMNEFTPTYELEAGRAFWQGLFIGCPISLGLWLAIVFGLYKVARLIWPMP